MKTTGTHKFHVNIIHRKLYEPRERANGPSFVQLEKTFWWRKYLKMKRGNDLAQDRGEKGISPDKDSLRMST